MLPTELVESRPRSSPRTGGRSAPDFGNSAAMASRSSSIVRFNAKDDHRCEILRRYEEPRATKNALSAAEDPRHEFACHVEPHRHAYPDCNADFSTVSGAVPRRLPQPGEERRPDKAPDLGH